VRRRLQSKLSKAARRAEHENPAWAALSRRIRRSGLPVHLCLSQVVADPTRDLRLRQQAARLLRDVARDVSAFVPLLFECIAAHDAKNQDLRSVIQSIGYGWGHLTIPEFEILYSTMQNGTAEQRYWIINEIAFFAGGPERFKVRGALIGILDDLTAPVEARAWAAERLHMHISQQTVHACVRACSDPNSEVRLWAVCTLGLAASRSGFAPHPLYRGIVAPVLERALADRAAVPGWWSVIGGALPSR